MFSSFFRFFFMLPLSCMSLHSWLRLKESNHHHHSTCQSQSVSVVLNFISFKLKALNLFDAEKSADSTELTEFRAMRKQQKTFSKPLNCRVPCLLNKYNYQHLRTKGTQAFAPFHPRTTLSHSSKLLTSENMAWVGFWYYIHSFTHYNVLCCVLFVPPTKDWEGCTTFEKHKKLPQNRICVYRARRRQRKASKKEGKFILYRSSEFFSHVPFFLVPQHIHFPPHGLQQ